MRDDLELLELKISKFLRYGVLVSAALMLVGWLGQLSLLRSSFSDFRIYQAYPFTEHLKELVRVRNWENLLSYLGLMVLISLPLIRVFLTSLLFFKQKERTLGWTALFVLVSLILSFQLGVVE